MRRPKPRLVRRPVREPCPICGSDPVCTDSGDPCDEDPFVCCPLALKYACTFEPSWGPDRPSADAAWNTNVAGWRRENGG